MEDHLQPEMNLATFGNARVDLGDRPRIDKTTI
jgi:hypothetical protein